MSNILWRYYLEDNVDKFRALLATGGYASQYTPRSHGGGMTQIGSYGANMGSPVSGLGTSPRTTMKSRKASAGVGHVSGAKSQAIPLTKSDLNSRDHTGLTILHRAVSSTGENAIGFALSLIEHPAVDIYLQDYESGWTCLHRALYFGNITAARALMERDSQSSAGHGLGNTLNRTKTLFKIKDHEGNSPFDVYNATISRRTLQHRTSDSESGYGDDDEEEGSMHGGEEGKKTSIHTVIEGDEIFAFGSNKNLTLGFGDQDDRQHPEKINLKRPDHLLQRFYEENLQFRENSATESDLTHLPERFITDLPVLIKYRPIIIQDVALSKLHSAILTTDPEANLYMCGFGPGGRLGTGDETTNFNYVCIEGGALEGKKVIAVALGQNHTLAVSSTGEIFSWGTNTWGVLGYSLPRPIAQDEEPVNNSPRQIFGLLKRETIIGVAASAIHSVAHTSTSVYTWGKNEGQLGLMDSDSMSLEAQIVPRKVAASLFTSPIVMVSAINRATTCLLANHTVYVFTNYGYSNVKFPLYGGFTNYHLSSTTLSTRYEAEASHISLITSGGDTIAAVSSRGDLFTINVSQKLDPSPTATSTTNPAKIRNSLSQPQRIWSLRKGNWDGIKSVAVGENGSVIICTQAGAVWRRVKRIKVKDAFASGSGDMKAKDYKFQRVPGLTKVVAVRSNTFGSFAAVRKDCDVTKTQILVDDQTLWKDLGSLLSIQGLEATELLGKEAMVAHLIPNSQSQPVKRAVLTSADIESDVALHLRTKFSPTDEYDVEICTTLSDTTIPVHGFMLAGRSAVVREALAKVRKEGNCSIPELMSITSVDGKLKYEFSGLDFITILNLVLYLYTDTVVDVWHFTRHTPKLAYRYRQIRVELMKLAAKLNMSKLEAAVRLMSEPQRHLNRDLEIAFQDPEFFEDGDAVIELDGGERVVHSALVCQRCPFFEGLFNGRAGGHWLLERRQNNSEAVKIDMKHIDPTTFDIVLKYLYTDVGPELFDDIVSPDIDTFSDLVMDVMFVANELMLDRLSQICQQVIGGFVNTRNVCTLVNAVALCSVTKFKDAALEYICLQLEAILENHLLNDLDDDLLFELNDVVRDNQLACLPFAKSGRAELLLHEQHPSLAEEISEDRHRIIRDIVFRMTVKDEESRLSSSFRARVGSPDDFFSSSPSQDKLQRKTRRNAPFSPIIQSQEPSTDMMFDMDDEDAIPLDQPASPYERSMDLDVRPDSKSTPSVVSQEKWHEVKGKSRMAESPPQSPPQNLPASSPLPETVRVEQSTLQREQSTATPWSTVALSSAKLDMKDIMAQASMGRTSALSMSLYAQRSKDDASKGSIHKMSQKERKKQQQQSLQQVISTPQFTLDEPSSRAASVAPAVPAVPPAPSSPWQTATRGPRTSLKDLIGSEADSIRSTGLAAPSTTKALPHRRTASPDTRFAGQQRSMTSTSLPKAKRPSLIATSESTRSSQPQPSKSSPLVPHSKSYTTADRKAEPSLQLSLADIIGQQKREQDIVKEAVAKRSLQEIQEEQAFQEWWDQESRRAQEEEALRARTNTAGEGSGNARGKNVKRGRGGGRGRGRGRGRGQGQGAVTE